jgi:Flp pilus assembly protein TadD
MTPVDEAYDAAIQLKDAGQLEEAAAKLAGILAIEPNHVLTHSALAVVLQRLGRLDEAVGHARRVTELEPDDPFSYTQLSVICQRCGRIAEAEDAMARSRMLQVGGHRH